MSDAPILSRKLEDKDGGEQNLFLWYEKNRLCQFLVQTHRLIVRLAKAEIADKVYLRDNVDTIGRFVESTCFFKFIYSWLIQYING